jgi:hypothetical protein
VLPIKNTNKITAEFFRKKNMSLPTDSRTGQALIGHLLGDGSLQRLKSSSILTPDKLLNSRFMFSQSLVREDYFYFVYDVFKSYCSALPFTREGY